MGRWDFMKGRRAASLPSRSVGIEVLVCPHCSGWTPRAHRSDGTPGFEPPPKDCHHCGQAVDVWAMWRAAAPEVSRG